MVRAVLALVRIDLIRALRRRETLLWLALMPLPFTFFFGMAFRSDPAVEEKTPLFLVAAETDPGVSYLRRALEQDGFEVHLQEKWTLDAALPNRGFRIDLPPRLGAVLAGQAEGGVTIWAHSGSLDVRRVEVSLQKDLWGARGILLGRVIEGQPVSAEALGQPPEYVPISVETKDWGRRREVPSGFKQSIPGNLVMFVLMAVLVTGAMRLLEDRETGRLRRLLAWPLSPRTVITAQFISLTLLGAAEALYYLLLARFVFRRGLGEHPLALYGLLVLFALAVSGIGILLGCLLRNRRQAGAAGIFLTLILAALGGAWWPMEIVPDWLQAIGGALPTGQAMNGLIRLLVWGDPLSALVPTILYFVVFALVAILLGARVLSRRLC